MANAYVYAISVDSVTRYIGKGTGRRVTDHLRLAKAYLRRKALGEAVTGTYLQRRLAATWRDGSDIEETIIRAGMTDQEAFDLEAFLIAEFPPGQLWNLAPGGAGFTSAMTRAQWQDPAYRAKLTAYHQDPEWCRSRNEATAATLRARFDTMPSERERMARQQREAWSKPGAKEARAARMSADRRLPTGPIARVLAAIGEQGATLDELCITLPDLDRRMVIAKTLTKLRKKCEIDKRGGKYNGVWFRTNIRSIAC